MKKYAYKGMIVTALTDEDAKKLGTLASSYLNLLDDFLTKDFSLTKSDRHVAEKKGSINIDASYHIVNKSEKQMNISFNIVFRPSDSGNILSNSTIDYVVKIGNEIVSSGSLSGKQIEKDKLKDELADVMIFTMAFEKI